MAHAVQKRKKGVYRKNKSAEKRRKGSVYRKGGSSRKHGKEKYDSFSKKGGKEKGKRGPASYSFRGGERGENEGRQGRGVFVGTEIGKKKGSLII